MALLRRVLSAEVIQAFNAENGAYSSRNDFVVRNVAPLKHGDLTKRKPLPYAIHLSRGRSLYLADIDPEAIRQAPFYHLHARQNAKTILSVPWEMGPINRPKSSARPIFCFSPGRCGSTLLSKLTNTAGIKSVSEPDFYLLLTSRIYKNRAWMRPLLRKLVSTLSHDLVSALAGNDPQLIVKLRSHGCYAAEEILAYAGSRPKTIFISRDFPSWARSRTQMRPSSADALLMEYRESLRCYEFLRAASECHLVRYEDLLADPLGVCSRILKFLGRPAAISADGVNTVMAKDSQEGTGIGQWGQAKPHWDIVKDDTLGLWNVSGLPALAERLDLYPQEPDIAAGPLMPGRHAYVAAAARPAVASRAADH